jgi:hypothetical protein
MYEAEQVYAGVRPVALRHRSVRTRPARHFWTAARGTSHEPRRALLVRRPESGFHGKLSFSLYLLWIDESGGVAVDTVRHYPRPHRPPQVWLIASRRLRSARAVSVAIAR